MSHGLRLRDLNGNITFDSDTDGAFLFTQITLTAGSEGILYFPELAGRDIIPVVYPIGGINNIANKTDYHMVQVVNPWTNNPGIQYRYSDYGYYQYPYPGWVPFSLPKGASELYIFVGGRS